MEWGREIASNIEKQIELKKMVADAFQKAAEEIQTALKDTEDLKDEAVRYYFDVSKGEYRIMTMGQSYSYNFNDIKVAIRGEIENNNIINPPKNNTIVFGYIMQEQIDDAVKKLIFEDLVDGEIL